MKKLFYVIVFNLYLVSGFSQEQEQEQKYGYLYAYINDTTTVTRVKEQLRSNNENLNNALKNFNVFSFKYPFPKIKDEYLSRTVARENSSEAVVSEFEFDEKVLYSGDYKVRFFEKATKGWIEFVINNRRGIESSEKYDFVMGPVANDSLYAAILLYEQGVLSVDAAIEQLKTYTLFDQLSFHTEKALTNLCFKTVVVL